MDDITEVLEQAASHLDPYAFDADALIDRTRALRRRRGGVAAAGGAVGLVAVAGLSFAGAQTLGSSPTAVPVAPLAGTPLRPTVPNPGRSLPGTILEGCGKPGARILIRIIPVTIPHRICNLSGVEVQGPDGTAVVVPKAGACAVAVPAPGKRLAGSTPQGLSACTADQGDVTVSRP